MKPTEPKRIRKLDREGGMLTVLVSHKDREFFRDYARRMRATQGVLFHELIELLKKHRDEVE